MMLNLGSQTGNLMVSSQVLNSLPDMPILGSSNSAANEDNYDVKNMYKWVYNYLTE